MARKVTEARRSALAAAAAFDGLPVKMSRMRLIDRIEIARTALNVSENEYLYLRLAFRNTPEDHWRGGREPIFGWSRVDVARALGKSERSITRIENALVEKGLIVHRDGPMLRRFGGTLKLMHWHRKPSTSTGSGRWPGQRSLPRGAAWRGFLLVGMTCRRRCATSFADLSPKSPNE
jgi:hypothetical protein